MPGPIWHVLFGREVHGALPEEAQLAVKNEWNAYLWGLQGGDLYYYPSQVREGYSLNSLGLSFHLLKTNEMFEQMRQYIGALRNTNEQAYRMLRAYGMGFLCHYCLDASIHSYVFPMEKQFCQEHPDYSREKDGNLHYRFEEGCAWLIYQIKRRPEDSMERMMSAFVMPADLERALEEFYRVLSMQLYQIDASVEPFSLCIASAYKAFSSRPKESDIPVEDVLNLQGRPWEIFDSPGEYLQDTVLSLHQQAVDRAVMLGSLFYNCCNENKPFDANIDRNHSYWKYEDPTWFRRMYNF